MFHRNRTHRLGGFTLIELAIVLGVVGIMAAGLWRLLSTSNQQLKDSATAQQQLALINAVKGYLADTTTYGGQNWLSDTSIFTTHTYATLMSSSTSCPANANNTTSYTATFCTYLPSGFAPNSTNPYGQSYTVQVLKGTTTANQNYSFMIATSGTPIPDTDGGRISGLIGGEGGFIYSSPVCSTAAAESTTACGALGAWSEATSTYGFGALSGSVASLSFVSSSTNSNYNWLARVAIPGDSANYTYNTMTTPFYLGGGTNSFNFGTYTATTATHAVMNVEGGTIDLGGGTFNVDGGTLTGSGGSALTLSGYADISTDTTPSTYSPALYVTDSNTTTTGKLCTDAGSCHNILEVIGNASVSNLLTVNGLWAYTFIYQSSDARLKINVKELSDPLADIMKLKPVSFAYKSNGKESMGVIAQDVEKVYPQLVAQSPNGFRAVNYDGMIAPLIGAVQELKKENDDLRAQLRAQAAHQEKTDQALEDMRNNR